MTDGGLQFEKAEFAEGLSADAATCGYCQQTLRHNYWSVDGKPACLRCKNQIATRGTEGSGFGRFVRATVFGSFAGALGAGLWYLIRAVTNLEIGLISVLVGFGVGVAVKAGSHGRGGPLYQALAIFLTYTAICGTYVPYIIQGLREKVAQEGQTPAAADPQEAGSVSPSASVVAPVGAAAPLAAPAPAPTEGEEPVSAGQAAVALVLLPIMIMALAYVGPFLGGFGNILGIAIIAFGLYEAWKINRRETPAISGPHAVARPSTPAPAVAAPDSGSSASG